MDIITYKYIDYKSDKFKEVINLRFNILFKPYGKINKYDYDEFDKTSFHLVALIQEKVVGYSRMTNINGKGKITNVVVEPGYAKNGIGFEMLRKHIIKAEENYINYIHLNSRLDTIGFYKKVGFKPKGTAFLSDKSGLMLQDMFYEIN